MTSEVIFIDSIFVSQKDKNAYVSNFIRICEEEDISDDSLWEQFQKDFERWTENDFKSDVFNTRLRHLRNFLRRRDVWVSRDKNTIIAKSLYVTLQEESLIKWTEEEIVNNAEKFIFNIIELLMKIDFDRKPKNYSWQAQRRSFNQSSSRSVNQLPPRLISLLSVPSPLPTPQRPPAPINPLKKEKQSDEQPDEQSDEQSDEEPNEQSDERPDEQSDESSVKLSTESSSDESSVKLSTESLSDKSSVKPSTKSFSDESSIKPSTESPSDESSVKPSTESPSDESSVKLPDESSHELSVELSVKRSFKPSYDWRSFISTIRWENHPYH